MNNSIEPKEEEEEVEEVEEEEEEEKEKEQKDEEEGRSEKKRDKSERKRRHLKKKRKQQKQDKGRLLQSNADSDESGIYFRKMLRKLILQDMAVLNEKAPESITAHLPICREPEYATYRENSLKLEHQERSIADNIHTKDELLEILTPRLQELTEKSYGAIQKVMEQLVLKIDSMERRLDNRIDELTKANEAKDETLREMVLSIKIERSEQSHYIEKRSKNRNYVESYETLSGSLTDQQRKKKAKHTSNKKRNKPPTAREEEEERSQSNCQLAVPGAERNSNNEEKNLFLKPSWLMKTNLRTVVDLVKEWYEGQDSDLSVVEKDRIHGSKWRKHCKSTYFRRKRVIKLIEASLELPEYGDLTTLQYAEYLDTYLKQRKLNLLQFIAKIPKGFTLESEIFKEINCAISEIIAHNS